MGEPPTRPVEDLEAMSPNDRDTRVRAGIVTDPESMPADLVERARQRIALRVAVPTCSPSRSTAPSSWSGIEIDFG
jgi:hypothetical protein